MREIDPRDCQHGYADSQQEEIDRLRTELKEAERVVGNLLVFSDKLQKDNAELRKEVDCWEQRFNTLYDLFAEVVAKKDRVHVEMKNMEGPFTDLIKLNEEIIRSRDRIIDFIRDAYFADDLEQE